MFDFFKWVLFLKLTFIENLPWGGLTSFQIRVYAVLIWHFPYVIAQIDDPQRTDDGECCGFHRSNKNKTSTP